jgi:hypothetical protein
LTLTDPSTLFAEAVSVRLLARNPMINTVNTTIKLRTTTNATPDSLRRIRGDGKLWIAADCAAQTEPFGHAASELVF